LTACEGGRTTHYESDFGELSLYRPVGVRSGNPIVEGARIAVHDVIGLLQNGETIDTLTVNCFPGLTRSQAYECLVYYEDHRGEIDVLVARQTAAPASLGGH
jgi:uncharacterized protein (DUF433 family)